MGRTQIRVLVADDHGPWRRFIRLALLIDVELQIIAEVSDGSAAIHKAQELRPDLILLDIGLPKLNGIEAARQIRKQVAEAKIVLVTENVSPEIAEEAFRIGACGYVVKSDAGSELLLAVKAALRGEKYVSSTLAGHGFTDITRNHSRLFGTSAKDRARG